MLILDWPKGHRRAAADCWSRIRRVRAHSQVFSLSFLSSGPHKALRIISFVATGKRKVREKRKRLSRFADHSWLNTHVSFLFGACAMNGESRFTHICGPIHGFVIKDQWMVDPQIVSYEVVRLAAGSPLGVRDLYVSGLNGHELALDHKAVRWPIIPWDPVLFILFLSLWPRLSKT